MLIHNKDDIEFVTEFPCFLGHPVWYSLESNLREVSKTLGNLAGGRELQSRVQNLEKKVSNLEDVEPKILKLEMEQANLLQTVSNLQVSFSPNYWRNNL